HSDWGQAGALYLRVAPANYADGFNQMVGGPSPRFISNRIFNDIGQNIFSENDISQWGWAWGQFIDHDIGLRDERELAGDHAPMPFSSSDPLESFKNDLGVLDFFRTPAAPGTGVRTSRGAVVRQEANSLTSFIDASQVYGVDNTRLDALRGGRDGNPANDGASLVLPNGYLPRQNDLAVDPVIHLIPP